MEYEILVPQYDGEILPDLKIYVKDGKVVSEGIDAEYLKIVGNNLYIEEELKVNKLQIQTTHDLIFNGKISCYDKKALIDVNSIKFMSASELINAHPKGLLVLQAKEYITHTNSTLYAGKAILETANGKNTNGYGIILSEAAKIISNEKIMITAKTLIEVKGIVYSKGNGTFVKGECLELKDNALIFSEQMIQLHFSDCHLKSYGQIVANGLLKVYNGGMIENHNFIAANETDITVGEGLSFINYAKILVNNRFKVGVWAKSSIIFNEKSFTQVGSFEFGHFAINEWQIGGVIVEGAELITTQSDEVSRISALKVIIKVSNYHKNAPKLLGSANIVYNQWKEKEWHGNIIRHRETIDVEAYSESHEYGQKAQGKFNGNLDLNAGILKIEASDLDVTGQTTFSGDAGTAIIVEGKDTKDYINIRQNYITAHNSLDNVKQRLQMTDGTIDFRGNTYTIYRYTDIIPAFFKSGEVSGNIYSQQVTDHGNFEVKHNIDLQVTKDFLVDLTSRVKSGEKISIKLEGDLINLGKILSEKGIYINGNRIGNTGSFIISEGILYLTAEQDINNSGTIEVKDGTIYFKAGRNINEPIILNKVDASASLRATIIVNGDLYYEAGNNIYQEAPRVFVANNFMQQADGDIIHRTIHNERIVRAESRYNSYTEQKGIDEHRAMFNIGGNMTLAAEGKVTLEGGSYNVGGNMAINGIEEVDIKAISKQAINVAFEKKRGLLRSSSHKVEWTVTQTAIAEFLAPNGEIFISSQGHCVSEGAQYKGAEIKFNCESGVEFRDHKVHNWRIDTVKKGGFLSGKVPIIDSINSDNPLKHVADNTAILNSLKQTFHMQTPTDLAGPMQLLSDAMRLKQDVVSIIKTYHMSSTAALLAALLKQQISASASFGSQKMENRVDTVYVIQNEVRAKKVNIESKGDLSATATEIVGEEYVDIKVANIALVSGQNTMSNKFSSKSKSFDIGASLAGVNIGVSMQNSNGNAEQVQQVPSYISGPKINLIVDDKLELKGAYINGKEITIAAARIEIQQRLDTARSEQEAEGYGVGVAVAWNGAVMPTGFISNLDASNQNSVLNFISGIMGDKVDIKAQKLIYNIEDIDAETVNLIVDEIEYIDRPIEDKSESRTEYNIGVDMGIDGKLHYSARFAHKDDDDVFSIYASPETWEGMQEIFDAFKAGKMPFFREEITVKEEVEEEQPQEEAKEEKPKEEAKKEEVKKENLKKEVNEDKQRKQEREIKMTLAYIGDKMDKAGYKPERKAAYLKEIAEELKAYANSDPDTQDKMYQKHVKAYNNAKLQRDAANNVAWNDQSSKGKLGYAVLRSDDKQPKSEKVVIQFIYGWSVAEWIAASLATYIMVDSASKFGEKVGKEIGNTIENHLNKPPGKGFPKNTNNVASAPGGMQDPGDPDDPRNDRKWQEWKKNAEGKWEHTDAKDFEGIPNRPNAQDPTLQEIYKQLWKSTDEIPGGTAQILREETKMSKINPNHLQKAEERLTQLLKRLNKADKNEIPLPRLEREVADRVANDLKDAINKYKNIKK